MTNLLYTVAVIMVVLWLLGYFSFHAGSIIHILLVIIAISLLFSIIRGNRATK